MVPLIKKLFQGKNLDGFKNIHYWYPLWGSVGS